MTLRQRLPLMFCLALAHSAASADAQQDQTACMSDAVTVRGKFIPNRERVATCLISNCDRISVACRTGLTHFKPAKVSQATLSTNH
jgi:hypothetical protein